MTSTAPDQQFRAKLSKSDKDLVLDVARMVVQLNKKAIAFREETPDQVGRAMVACGLLSTKRWEYRAREIGRLSSYKKSIAPMFSKTSNACAAALDKFVQRENMVELLDRVDDEITALNEFLESTARESSSKKCFRVDPMSFRVRFLFLGDATRHRENKPEPNSRD